MPLTSRIARMVLAAGVLAVVGLTVSACGRAGEPVLASEDDAAESNDLATIPLSTRGKSKASRTKPDTAFILDPLL